MANPVPLRLKVIVCKEEPDELLPRLRSKMLDVVGDRDAWFGYQAQPDKLADALAHAALSEVMAVRPFTPAEEELATLHEGEEPCTDPAVQPSPGQLLYQLNRATPQQRHEWAARSLANSDAAVRCFEGHHEAHVAEVRGMRQKQDAAATILRLWFDAASQRHQDGHATEQRHLAELHWALSGVLGPELTETPATCPEHDGVCFPHPDTLCPAHAYTQCRLCHRNPASCADSTGACSTWAATGMHHDSCQNRVRTYPPAAQKVDESSPAPEELVHPATEEQVNEPQGVDDPHPWTHPYSWPLAASVGTFTGVITTDTPLSPADQEAVRAAGFMAGTHLTRAMVYEAVQRKAAADTAAAGDVWRPQLDGSWTTDLDLGTLTMPADSTSEQRQQFLRAYQALGDIPLTSGRPHPSPDTP